MGRFINADIFVSTGQGVLGNNMFAYCCNNPVSKTDPSGKIGFSTVALTMAASGISSFLVTFAMTGSVAEAGKSAIVSAATSGLAMLSPVAAVFIAIANGFSTHVKICNQGIDPKYGLAAGLLTTLCALPSGSCGNDYVDALLGVTYGTVNALVPEAVTTTVETIGPPNPRAQESEQVNTFTTTNRRPSHGRGIASNLTYRIF